MMISMGRRLNLPGLACVGMILALFVSWSAFAETLGKGPVNPLMEASSSPYLQTHSKDLVRWRPWGEEAFAEARKSNKPIMVSFGYTACHWCHVMQETHFNEPVLSKLINDDYIPVLVDRERRPTLDESYMLVTESLTQRGGWPNTIFMTADRKPFYGTGYVPPELFHQILSAVTTGWQNDHDTLLAEADQMATLLTTFMTRKEAARAITPQVLADATRDIAALFDPFSGGIGTAPKFFQQPVLMFLLQQAERNSDATALAAVELTLQSVLSGGIHDHIEGGFHRYAVDQQWRVPHFEKMLYDQALMSETFTDAYRLTGKPEYGDTARKTFDYILADLTSEKGGFFATRDADSEGEEGTYYVWSEEELVNLLGAEDAAFAVETFDTVADGELAGKVIINFDNVEDPDRPRIEKILDTLGKTRATRQKPRRDEKIVASWNGMTIASLAQASTVLSEPRYGAAAVKAGEFIWNAMRHSDGTLMRTYFGETGEIDGELEDYAHVARSFLFLFDLTMDRIWLERAESLAETMTTRFEDPEAGDFFSTADNAGFGRIKSRSDVDQPSGNAVALDVLVRLARRTANPDYARKAEKTVAALSGLALKSPAGGVSILGAADRLASGETGSIQYGGNGAVRVEVMPSDKDDLVHLRLHVADGWHINADQPLEDHLIPTLMDLSDGRGSTEKTESGASSAQITYPEPAIKSLKFNSKPMALFEGSFDILARLDADKSDGATRVAILQLQTCSDEICLLPETLRLQFAASNGP